MPHQMSSKAALSAASMAEILVGPEPTMSTSAGVMLVSRRMRAVSMAVLQTRGREAAREVEDGREADPVLRFRNLRSAARTHRLVVVAEGHLDAAVERPVRVGAVGGDRRLFAVADRPMPTSALFTASARRSEGVAL